MKCENAVNNYLEMDHYKNLSFRTKFHIRFCPQCEKELRLLAKNLKAIQKTTPFILQSSLSSHIMNSIAVTHSQQEQQGVSNFKWLFVGLLLLAGIFLIPFNEQLHLLRLYFGASFEVPLVIVFGLAVTLYPVIYIGTHLDKIKDRIHFYFDR